ncbi:putative 28S rRNA (cytosine-C(5))-methyltransferase [Prunus yedoensis var. nudiflora]|uniref:Putative 28S rRNA (Cytosine-C(5))-methyltransferase n=1 Tax=Prunus yedoensis var. nudiflora TaxID=2094558 RepID=A0A314ULF6_PRUYE|nr:putative 28S rRNA (cytosine-C(5))-methyltransferase [Prunus yedoensis var. nudiflora]
MARRKHRATPPSAAADKSDNRRHLSMERSAYFARREAAKVLKLVLQGDAKRQSVGSIKTLVYGPSVRNKKGTFALICQTLKYLLIIQDVLKAADVLNSKWKKQDELVYIVTYDILFGQVTCEFISGRGCGEVSHASQEALQAALARLLVKKKVKSVEELIALYDIPDISNPRYVRVNTLKMDVETAVLELQKQFKVQKDDLVPDLLVLPPGSDLHDHHLIKNGNVFMQGKASSMVAAALAPKPEWEVLDACSAPGNKTVHIAALMRGKGKVIACELNEQRVKRLKETIRLSGASNIKVVHGDFLDLNPEDLPYSKVRAILLDPSCSGSGTASVRLDHLLPSSAPGQAADFTSTERLNKLAAFQRKALAHALSFPDVERVVYSTCSVNQVENEDVVKSVLPLAASNGFQLETPFPEWHRRGLPVVEGAECLLRTDPKEDKEGFFIALFVRRSSGIDQRNLTSPTDTLTELRRRREVMWELISICLKCLHMRI